MNVTEVPGPVILDKETDTTLALSSGTLSNLALKSDIDQYEVGVDCRQIDGQTSFQRINGNKHKLQVAPLPAPSSEENQIDGWVFLHSHPLNPIIREHGDQEREEGFAKVVLPSHSWGDIEICLERMMGNKVNKIESIPNDPGGLNILTEKGFTMYIGHEVEDMNPDESSSWEVLSERERGFKFNRRDSQEWKSKRLHQSPDDHFVLEYRIPDIGIKMKFLFVPWMKLMMLEWGKGLKMEDIIFGEGLKKLKEEFNIQTEMSTSLSQAMKDLNIYVSALELPQQEEQDQEI